MNPKSVVVVGAMNVDLAARAERFPRPGETLVGESFYRGFGGKGANQAVAAARMGVPVTFVGRVGDDAFGAEMIAHLQEQGVDTTHTKAVGDCASDLAQSTDSLARRTGYRPGSAFGQYAGRIARRCWGRRAYDLYDNP